MGCKIIVLEGADVKFVRELFYKQMRNAIWYSEEDFCNVSLEEKALIGGEGKIVLTTFSRFVIRVIADAKKRGKKPIVCLDDFVAHVDFATEIDEYVLPLLEVCEAVIYFGTPATSLMLRESGLPVEYYGTDVYYNGAVYEADEYPIEEGKTFTGGAWSPDLFKNKEECLAFLKAAYSSGFKKPIYEINTVCVGRGWKVLDTWTGE